MNRMLVAAAALTAAISTGVALEGKAPAAGRPGLLVETGWLDENIIRPEILIVDLRPRDRFDQGHIPGSYNLDEARLSRKESALPSVLPPDEFKAVMESLGIGEGVHVVAVDDFGGRSAARLWWALGYYGFDNVSLLNGGFERWAGEGRATTLENAYQRTAIFVPRPRPERAASAEQVRDWRKNKPGGIIVDARSIREFDGTARRGRRGGHIPGAVNIPWDETLALRDDARLFKPEAEILAILKKGGITKETPVVAYCTDGRRASHLLFSMALVGLSGSNYLGSWSEWSSRQDLPVEGEKAGSKPAPPTGRKIDNKAGPAPPKP